MYIGDKAYGVCGDIEQITNFRLLLNNFVYPQTAIVDQLIRSLSMCIESLNVEFNPQCKCVTFKIKKTAMKRNSAFHHDASYYYPLIGHSFASVFRDNRRAMIEILTTCMSIDEARITVDSIIQLPDGALASLCDVGCISDNIISITF